MERDVLFVEAGQFGRQLRSTILSRPLSYEITQSSNPGKFRICHGVSPPCDNSDFTAVALGFSASELPDPRFVTLKRTHTGFALPENCSSSAFFPSENIECMMAIARGELNSFRFTTAVIFED